MRYHETIGRVVAYTCHQEEYYSHSDMLEFIKVYYPIIAFQVDGKEYRCISKDGPKRSELGQEIKVIYNPKDPTKSGPKYKSFKLSLILFAIIIWICTKL